MGRLGEFLTQLWKRRVVQFGALYLAVAWVALQVVMAIETTLELPDWMDKVTLLFFAAGFPLALILAWAQEKQSSSTLENEEIASHGEEAKNQAISGDERPTVIVLPFLNMSSDSDKEYFADGMTEDLISGLSQSKQLLVTARSISFGFKSVSPDIRAIGRDLGVRYVVEGSIRPMGDRIRVSVQLVDASTVVHLWAKKYDQPTDRIFDVQDEMIASIAAALGAQLTTAEAERAAMLKPDDLTSWQAIQRSLQILTYSFITKEEVDGAVARLEVAVAKNPEHVYARAALAWFAIMRVVNFCSEDLAADMQKYTSHLEVASTMMGDDPYALMLVGHALAFGGRSQEARDTLERAIQLNPGSTDPYPGYAIALSMLKEFDGAHAALQKARGLSSAGGFAVNFDWFDGFAYGVEGDFDRAMPVFKKIAAAQPMFPTIHIWLAIGYAKSGDTVAASKSLAKAIHAAPPISLRYLKAVPFLHPDTDEHLRRIALIEPHWPEESVT